MAFHIGQKVVCVSIAPSKYGVGNPGNHAVVGGIYTIREIDARALHIHGTVCLRFEGIHLRVMNSSVGEWEIGYPATHFRPVVEKKTDISIFTAMLNRQPQTVG